MDRRITVKMPKSLVQIIRKDRNNAQAKTQAKISFTSFLVGLVEDGRKARGLNGN